MFKGFVRKGKTLTKGEGGEPKEGGRGPIGDNNTFLGTEAGKV